MNKLELKLAFDQYLTSLKEEAFKLIDENNYDNIVEVMKDCVNVKVESKKSNVKSIFGNVYKQGVTMQIEEGLDLFIFSQEVEQDEEV